MSTYQVPRVSLGLKAKAAYSIGRECGAPGGVADCSAFEGDEPVTWETPVILVKLRPIGEPVTLPARGSALGARACSRSRAKWPRKEMNVLPRVRVQQGTTGAEP